MKAVYAIKCIYRGSTLKGRFFILKDFDQSQELKTIAKKSLQFYMFPTQDFFVIQTETRFCYMEDGCRAQSQRLTGRICDQIFGCAPKNSCAIAPVRRKTQSTVRLTYFRLYLRTRTRKTVYVYLVFSLNGFYELECSFSFQCFSYSISDSSVL